jgi:tRNA-Thr(GGU) m(6)t(6)A37 methyltransferase TsaA
VWFSYTLSFIPVVDLFFLLYATRQFDSNPDIHQNRQNENFSFPDCKMIRFPGKVPEQLLTDRPLEHHKGGDSIISFEPIGTLHTCFKEKFGIPRQNNLVKKAPGTLVFNPKFAREEAVRGLEGFSHIWLLFVFHEIVNDRKEKQASRQRIWSPMVRPPRLGGNKKVGVFASRSPFRPNPVGMSAVRLQAIEMTAKGPLLHLTGVDILDQTPILDIKPYLPYSDVIPDADDGFAKGPPAPAFHISFTDQALEQIREREDRYPHLTDIIKDILANDPRPAYRAEKAAASGDRVFGIRLFDFDLRWKMAGDQILVLELIVQTDI